MMRVSGISLVSPLRSVCASTRGVLHGRVLTRIPPAVQGPSGFRRYNHSYSHIASRISTVRNPFNVTERPNVCLVKDHAEFHSNIYSLPEHETVKPEDLVVSIFVSRQNTASLSVLECVEKLAEEFPRNKFLVIDADQVPRAAYDADLQQFPAALVSFGGDIHRELVQETAGYPADWQATLQWELPSSSESQSPVECVLPESFYKSVKKSIMAFGNSFSGKKVASLTTRCGTHSYTHGIDTDNLNLKRVGWPTE